MRSGDDRAHPRPDPVGQASTRPDPVFGPQFTGGCIAEGGQQPQRDVAVAEHEASRVQPGDDLGAERVADEVRRPALRRVREHRERQLVRAVGQATPIECRVAAVAEMRQARQLRLVHHVHLGLRWTPPHVVALGRPRAAAACRCRHRTSQDGRDLTRAWDDDGQTGWQGGALGDAYDPTFGYEVAVIIQEGLRRMFVEQEDVFYYLTLLNENYVHPPMPKGLQEGILRGMYLLHEGLKRALRSRASSCSARGRSCAR